MSTGKTVFSITASKPLVNALKTAAKVATKRFSNKVFEYLRIQVAGNDVTVEATDLNIWFRQTVFMPGLDAERVCLLVHQKMVASLKIGATLNFGASWVTINGVAYTPPFKEDDFPKFPELAEASKGVPLDKQYFADLKACSVSASVAEVRPVLTGVIHRYNTIAATDGMRLLVAEQPVEWDRDFNVPASAADLLYKAFGETGARLRHDDHRTQYNGNGYLISVRLIDGVYPDIRRIFPPKFTTSCRIPIVDPWLNALNSACLVHKQANKKDSKWWEVRVDFKEQGGVNLHVQRGELMFETSLEAEWSGSPLTIHVDAQYLKDALIQIDDGAFLEFSGPETPFIITSAPQRQLYRRKALLAVIGKKKQ